MKAEYQSHYLTDHDIANFARHSFSRLAEEFTPEQNHRLIRFLARGMTSGDWNALCNTLWNGTGNANHAHQLATYLRKIPEHWVPFGHPQITLRMNAPVPIRVQCFKHKIGFVESEESRRYISSTPELYVPAYLRAKPQGSIKQGSGDEHEDSAVWLSEYQRHCWEGIKLYEHMIEAGICPEQARFALPQGCRVNWVWTGSLYAYANFYNQRSDSHAQQEIQELAAQVDAIIRPLFPVAWPALVDGDY